MSGKKEPPDKLSREENPFVQQWTNFEWEKITDNMRRAIENTSRTGASFTKTSPLDLESVQQNSKINVDGLQVSNISTLRDGLYFNPTELLDEITSPTDHPSQLVDALKVGLADILDGSKLKEQDDSSDDEIFSKSLDETYDDCSKSDLEADSVSPINRVVGSSESDGCDDDVTDISTTESKESVVEVPEEPCKVPSTTTCNEEQQDNKEEEDSCACETASDEMEKDTLMSEEPTIASSCSNMDSDDKNDIDPVSCESLETSESVENINKETTQDESSSVLEQDENATTTDHEKNEDVAPPDKNEDVTRPDKNQTETQPDNKKEMSTSQQNEETVNKEVQTAETSVPPVKSSAAEPVEQDDDPENWKKDITVEEISYVQDIQDADLVDGYGHDKLGEELAEFQSDLSNQDINKITYADVLKKGLRPDVITPVKPLTFSLCCQKERRAASEANSKSPKKTPNKDRKSRRAEYTTRKQKASPSHGSRAIPDKSTSTPPRSPAKSSARKDQKRDTIKSPSRKTTSCRKISFDQCEYWYDDTPSESASSNSDDPSTEELLREKIKREQIAKLLQEAKLTLAKLTSESLGSYEKVSCLKQVPSANIDTFELLQCQEINKSKHMKELANSLHELTQMGLGNAKEFAEIKDILISLHYLQSKDKYFVEKTKEKTAGEKTTKITNCNKDKDSSVSVFFIVFSLFILFMFIFKRQWFIIICVIVLISLCIFGQQKCTKTEQVNGHKKQVK